MKNSAIEAEENYCEMIERAYEWQAVVECSDRLVKFLDLDIGDQSKALINNLISIDKVVNQSLAESETKRKELILEYALAILGGKPGDILDYADYCGRERAIVVEEAEMLGGGVTVSGKRFLKSGRIGTLWGHVHLDIYPWKLRMSNTHSRKIVHVYTL